MEQSDVLNWLVDWFKQRGPVPGVNVVEHIRSNYYESGLMDSLGVLTLITDVEEHFGVRFSSEDFQDRRFSTIEGLSQMIVESVRARPGH